MRRAMLVSGIDTRKAAVEAALQLLIEVHGQTSIRGLRGNVRWGWEETGKGATSCRADKHNGRVWI
jgi:hypothetical protein